MAIGQSVGNIGIAEPVDCGSHDQSQTTTPNEANHSNENVGEQTNQSAEHGESSAGKLSGALHSVPFVRAISL